jgi:hypothetical protein
MPRFHRTRCSNTISPSILCRLPGALQVESRAACSDVTIDTAKHSNDKGWNGGAYKTANRYESNLTAIDPVTGEIKKTVHLQYPSYSGTVSTGGGLVFLGLTDGTVAAFDDTTLEQLWKINVGSGFSAPPMTFEVGSKQYIAIASGPSASAKAKLVNTLTVVAAKFRDGTPRFNGPVDDHPVQGLRTRHDPSRAPARRERCPCGAPGIRPFGLFDCQPRSRGRQG